MQQRRRRSLALGLASAGVATAAISMMRVWNSQHSPGYLPPARVWPLPALYLVEVVALALVVFLAALIGRRSSASFVAWAAVGALSAMALLGAMTIGLTIALPLIFLVPARVLSEEKPSKSVSHRVAGFAVGVVCQAGVMIGIIQYLLHRPTSGPPLG